MGRREAVVAVGAVALLLAWRARRRRSRPARFVSSGEMGDPDEIDAFWTDERLDSAKPEDMPTIDPAYWASLLALHRWLWWLPEERRFGAAHSVLHQLGRLEHALDTVKGHFQPVRDPLEVTRTHVNMG